MTNSATLPRLKTTYDVSLQAYSSQLLRPLVSFWNKEFADRRNFFPITESIFRQRVVEKNYPEEPFDPDGLILAVDNRPEGKAVVGMIHCGVRSEEFCTAVYDHWSGGDQPYVAFFAVAGSCRYRGIGTALWHAAESYFYKSGCFERPVVDSQCLNPFYGNSDGLYPPFWGTTEGVGVSWDDTSTRRFLSLQGYEPVQRAVSLEMSLGTFRPFRSGAEKALAEKGFTLQWLAGRRPNLGGKVNETLLSNVDGTGGSMCCLKGDVVVGALASYSMDDVQPNKTAIYDFETLSEYRGLGIGKAMLWELLSRLRDDGGTTCEVTTIPSISPQADVLYRQAGFRPVAEWAVY